MKTRNERLFDAHALNEEQQQSVQQLRQHCKVLAQLIDEACPAGPEKSVAIKRLRECLMWANSAIALDITQQGEDGNA